MRVGTAEARQRFSELLDAVSAGEVVEVSRRGRVVAVLTQPAAPAAESEHFGAAVARWRAEWDVSNWPEADPFEAVRDTSPGRPPTW